MLKDKRFKIVRLVPGSVAVSFFLHNADQFVKCIILSKPPEFALMQRKVTRLLITLYIFTNFKIFFLF